MYGRSTTLSMEWTPRLLTASMCQSGDVCSPLTEGASNMKVKAVGIDLAKNVFQIHRVDGEGKVPLRKQFKPSQVASFFANLLPDWDGGLQRRASLGA